MEYKQQNFIQMQEKRKSIQDYLAKEVNVFIQPLVYELVKKRPANPSRYALSWLEEYVAKQSAPSEGEVEEVEEVIDDEQLNQKKKGKQKVSRRGISEEVFGNYNKKSNKSIKCIQKPEEVKTLILGLIRDSILFQNLDDKDETIIVNAMEEIKTKEGDQIIVEGESGNNLYIVAEGAFDCYKKIQGEEQYLKTYQRGEAFGELALMYNAPRAATIVSKEEGKLYALDRVVFSQIVKAAAVKKRQLYQKVLEKVQIFSDLNPREKEQLYDVLHGEKYEPNEYIIRQGETGHEFYIVVDGVLVAEKQEEGQEAKVVYKYQEGDYFGELALLHDQPRQASVKVIEKAQVAKIDRESFKRLLGNLEDILKRNQERYKNFQPDA